MVYGGSAVLIVIGSMVGGMIAGMVIDALTQRNIASLEHRTKRLELALISPKGVENRIAKEERMEEAMLRVAELIKEGKKPEEALKEVAMAYPDVAIGMVQRALKNGQLGSLLSNLK